MAIKFKSDEDKRDNIIKELQSLQDTLGWRVIEKALDENIKDTEAKLHGEKKLASGESIELLQDKRRDRVRLRNLPNDLIEEYGELKSIPPELDPYE